MLSSNGIAESFLRFTYLFVVCTLASSRRRLGAKTKACAVVEVKRHSYCNEFRMSFLTAIVLVVRVMYECQFPECGSDLCDSGRACDTSTTYRPSGVIIVSEEKGRTCIYNRVADREFEKVQKSGCEETLARPSRGFSSSERGTMVALVSSHHTSSHFEVASVSSNSFHCCSLEHSLAASVVMEEYGRGMEYMLGEGSEEAYE